MPTIRPLNQSEKDLMQKTLDEFTTHFADWWQGDYYRGEYYRLLSFCYYEQCSDNECCRDILERAAPHAVGDELVRRHSFRWAAQEDDPFTRIGVAHDKLPFLDLFSLDNGHMIAREDRRSDHELLKHGEKTCESLRSILALIHERSSS